MTDEPQLPERIDTRCAVCGEEVVLLAIWVHLIEPDDGHAAVLLVANPVPPSDGGVTTP